MFGLYLHLKKLCYAQFSDSFFPYKIQILWHYINNYAVPESLHYIASDAFFSCSFASTSWKLKYPLWTRHTRTHAHTHFIDIFFRFSLFDEVNSTVYNLRTTVATNSSVKKKKVYDSNEYVYSYCVQTSAKRKQERNKKLQTLTVCNIIKCDKIYIYLHLHMAISISHQTKYTHSLSVCSYRFQQMMSVHVCLVYSALFSSSFA